MHVDLQTVCRVFEDVLNGTMSREQADRWAYAVVQEEETGVVMYSPPRERDRIWAGVTYLYGIDTMKAPGEYLHSDNDIRAAMTAKLIDVADEEAAMPSRALDQRRRNAQPARLVEHGRWPRGQDWRLAILDAESGFEAGGDEFAQAKDMSSGGATLSGSGLT